MRARVQGRLGAALALALAAAVGLAACGGDDGAAGGTAELHGLVRTPPLQVGDVTLPQVDATGAETPFAFRAQPGHLLVAYFGYTNCPDLCPTTFADLRSAEADLGEDKAGRIDVVFTTVDPERDSGEKLNAYLGSFFTSGTYAVRTPDRTALETAQDAFLATSSVKTDANGKIEVSHTGITYVIDPAGTVLVEWPFGTSSEAMAADLDALLATVGDAEGGTEAAAPSAALPLTFTGAWARTSADGADNGAVYLTVTSNQDVDDTLTAVAVDPAVATEAMVHETVTKADGSMSMNAAGGLVVPAGGALTFEPGGLHIMLTGLEKPLLTGQRFAMTLTFDRAGRQEVSVEVKEQP